MDCWCLPAVSSVTGAFPAEVRGASNRIASKNHSQKRISDGSVEMLWRGPAAFSSQTRMDSH
ncbi:hypothetical protein DV515_00010015 [Chloebia gouldiae]|uniref:Uncharacterized protein n=1 Tax=Chloebia gouldiae TaxID=44316 RepID=A0A3L8SBS4_CHLGU|nr:hypothetical protein DV515_00010015 [Chloebia gouldiae]